MCDTKDPCCVSSPLANKITCAANGGKVDSNPCNVMNPLASTSSCNAQTVTNNVSKFPTWLIVIIVIGVLIVVSIIGLFMPFGRSGMYGGKRMSGIGKLFKKIF